MIFVIYICYLINYRYGYYILSLLNLLSNFLGTLCFTLTQLLYTITLMRYISTN